MIAARVSPSSPSRSRDDGRAGPATLMLASALFGTGYGLIFPAVTGAISLAATTRTRGRAFGLFNAAFSVGLALGAPIAGGLADAVVRVSGGIDALDPFVPCRRALPRRSAAGSWTASRRERRRRRDPLTGIRMAACDVAVVGGGLVGLATAMQLLEQRPDLSVIVLEREADVGRGQSSRNSGVLHAGLYYPPGSAKARWCTAGKSAHGAVLRGARRPAAAQRQARRRRPPEELPRLAAPRRACPQQRRRDPRARRDRGARARAERHRARRHPLADARRDRLRLVAQAMARRIRAAGGEVRTSARSSIDAPAHGPVRSSRAPARRGPRRRRLRRVAGRPRRARAAGVALPNASCRSAARGCA
jgi:hypothetical protein